MTPTLLLALSLTQPPADPPRTVTPADIQRAAATLRLLQVARSGQFDDPELKKAVEAFLKANPNFDTTAFQGLLRDTPGADISPELRDQAMKIAEQIVADRARQAAGQPTLPDTPQTPPKNQSVPTKPSPNEESPFKPEAMPDPAQSPDSTPPETPSADGSAPDASATPPVRQPASGSPDDRGGQMLRWWEQNVGPLDKTPAFKGVVQEFLRGIDPSSRDRGALGELLSGTNSKQAGEWAAAIAEAVGGFKNDANDAASTMPDAPDLQFPSTPATPSLSRVGLLLAVVGILGAVAYFWRRIGLPGITGEPRARRVPAPQPATIRDRASLVAAVDQLAAHLLGPEALPLNHRALGQALTPRCPAGALTELIGLYEVARYAPARDEFPTERLPAARSALAAVLDSWR